MKKIIIRIAAIIIVLAVGLSILLGSVVIYANANIDYNLDEKLFLAAQKSNTTAYLAYNAKGELTEIFKDSSGGAKSRVSLSDVPRELIEGFIAVEDRDFYKHNGINVRRTVGAAVNQLLHFSSEFGGSTITQQVIKNISGDNERTVKRKLLEVLRSIHLEMLHSKDEILELYLNVIPMPENMFGIKEGAASLFNKEPRELTIAECATLIGIANAPSRYNPRVNYNASLEKRNTVLTVMMEEGIINKEQYLNAKKAPITLVESELGKSKIYSWFVETAREDVIRDLCTNYGMSRAAAHLLLSSGTKVVLTVNPDIQTALEEFFENEGNLSKETANGLEYSMVVTDNKSGNLLGIIGGAGKKVGNLLYNNALAKHPPASTLKPLALYAPLIDSGKISWSTMFDDVPKRSSQDGDEIIVYPHNSPDIYEGRITLYDAIIKSKNTVAVELADYLGYENIFNYLNEAYGFDLFFEKSVRGKTVTDIALAPLALGQLTEGVSLRQLTEAYTAFANNGVLSKGRSYYGVFADNGDVLLENAPEEKRVFKKSTAQLMNMLLSGVVEEGTARNINLKYSIDTAGKTGTSGMDKDRLFVGYTPDITAGIWTGYTSEGRAIGSQSPNHLQIWDSVMQRITSILQTENGENLPVFPTDSLKRLTYCKETGMLANDLCEDFDETALGYFVKGDEPKSYCELHAE